MDHPHPVRVAREVVPVLVGPRPRRRVPAETRHMRRAPRLPVRRTYLPPYSPQKSPPHAVLQTQLLQVAPPTATPLAPAGRAPVGSMSALDLAWADAKGSALPPVITPASMAIAWSPCAGSAAWSRWRWSSRSLGWRWVGRQCLPALHVQ